MTTRNRLDEILCGHASDLDGQPINVGTLTSHLYRASDRIIAAALLHAWWGPAGDQLGPRLAQLNDATGDLYTGVEHDPPCHLHDQGQCDTCDGITYDALTDALDALRALLGDAVCTDLTGSGDRMTMTWQERAAWAATCAVGDPDPCPDLTEHEECCLEPDPVGFSCTLLAGHAMQHVAGTGRTVVAVWPVTA